MRPCLPFLLLVALIPSGACSRTSFPVSRSWLAQDGGVVLGTPTRGPDGLVTLPVELKRRRPFTAEMIRSVEAAVDDRKVRLTVIGGPRGPKWPPWDGAPVPLGRLAPGAYEVLIVEPRGAPVPLGHIDVPD